MTGMGVGTSSLVTQVTAGALSSGALILESITKGLAQGGTLLVTDKEYKRDITAKRERNTTSTGGLVQGLAAGGESILTGLSSGLSGLINRPIEEGRKGGAIGFVKGLGLGTMEMVVKPVVGVTDGISNIAHGFSYQMTELTTTVFSATPVRPCRVFERSFIDYDELVIVPMQLHACIIQEFIKSLDSQNSYVSSIVVESPRLKKANRHSRSNRRPFGPTAVVTAGGVGSNLENITNVLEYQAKHVSDEDPVMKIVAVSDTILFMLNMSEEVADKDNPLSVSQSHIQSNPLLESKDTSTAASPSSTATSARSVSSSQQQSLASNTPIIDWKFSYGEISHAICHTQLNIVEVILYKNRTVRGSIPILCDSLLIAVKLYTVLYHMNFKMGNPAVMTSPDALFNQSPASAATLSLQLEQPSSSPQAADRISSSPTTTQRQRQPMDHELDVLIGFRDYQFGSINHTKSATMMSSNALYQEDDRTFLQRHSYLMSLPYKPWQGQTTILPHDILQCMDERLWCLISEWKLGHQTMHIHNSRCCGVLVINRSDNPVQLLKYEVVEGKNIVVMNVGCSAGYDNDSRVIYGGGGACVVFSYGFLPTLFDLAHVKIRLQTSAFTGQFSTRTDRTSLTAEGGHQVSFLEKTQTEWWVKYVVLISS